MVKNLHSHIKLSKLKVLVCVLLSMMFLFSAGYSQEISKSHYFTQITDIHFNPYYDPNLVPRLIHAGANQWESIFDTSAVKGFGVPGQDETSYTLFISALQSIAKNSVKPDFIIYTGDFLAHNFDNRFQTYAKPGDQYSDFVVKTITFMTLMFNKYLPEVRVYFCLGNNDSDTGDYQIAPDGAFLHHTAPVLAANFIKDPKNQKTFNQTYPSGGYYNVAPLSHAHIISLNTDFFSTDYKVPSGYDPGTRELDWLERQLADARNHQDKVWLVMHIPPGANVSGAISKKQFVPMWQTLYNDRFIRILKANAAVIAAGFAGHTHMDDFRVLFQFQSPSAVSFINICPAVSPQFNNNPGYQQFYYEPQAFSLTDYTTYWLNLEGTAPAAAQWHEEYTFSNVYGLKEITAASLLKVYHLLDTNGALQDQYINHYNVSNPSLPVMTGDNFTAYWCGIGNWIESDFNETYFGEY